MLMERARLCVRIKERLPHWQLLDKEKAAGGQLWDSSFARET